MHCTSGKSGRRNLAFEDSSEWSKGRKSKEFRETVGFPELTRVTKMSLRSATKTDAAKLFSEALETTPTRGSRIRKAMTAHAKTVLILTSVFEERIKKPEKTTKTLEE
jgi:hypothetical protein